MQDQVTMQSEVLHLESPLKKIGKVIKEARESKNLSIEDLAESLRIGEEQLEAIENGSQDLLPEKVFIKAMIRRVAERLHLEVGDLINEFETEGKSLTNTAEEKTEDFTLRRMLKILPPWGIFTSAIILASSGLAIGYFITNQSKTPQSQSKALNKIDSNNEKKGPRYHIVTKGQTLYIISKFHNIPIQTLIRINELNNPNELKIGMKIALRANFTKLD